MGEALDRLVVRGALAAARRATGLRRRSEIVDGEQWSYLIGGNRAGPTLVLVHGFSADNSNWLVLAPFLTRHYRLICPDLPGFGLSERRPGADYTTDAQARRLDRFLSQLGVGAFHLGGNSMGGLITLRYALRFPERLRSILLFNAAGVPGSRKSELEHGIDQGLNLLATRVPDDAQRKLEFVMHRSLPLPGAYRRVMYLEGKADEALHDHIFGHLSAEGTSPELTAQLHAITAPALVIWGRQDRVIDVSSVAVLQRELPRCTALILDQTGHMPMIERPIQCAKAVRAHIGAWDARRGPAATL